MNKKNEGVYCKVCDCVYHEGTDKCIADKIEVNECYSQNGENTFCKTFCPNCK